jgi:hypothetical protein
VDDLSISPAFTWSNLLHHSNGNLGKLKHSATVEFGAPIEYTVFRVTPENPEGVLLTKTMFNDMNVSEPPFDATSLIALPSTSCVHTTHNFSYKRISCHTDLTLA